MGYHRSHKILFYFFHAKKKIRHPWGSLHNIHQIPTQLQATCLIVHVISIAHVVAGACALHVPLHVKLHRLLAAHAAHIRDERVAHAIAADAVHPRIGLIAGNAAVALAVAGKSARACRRVLADDPLMIICARLRFAVSATVKSELRLGPRARRSCILQHKKFIFFLGGVGI